MLVSGSDPSQTYVGQSTDLKERMRRHNSPWGGSRGTIYEHGKPWLLAAYVCGFRTKGSRLAFEGRLQSLRNQRFRRANVRGVSRLVDLAEELVHAWQGDSLHVTSLLPGN